MAKAKLTHTVSGAHLVENLVHARSFWSRLKGLLGRKYLPSGEGLLLEPCSEIHMWGMAFAIDVVFLRKTERADTYEILACYRDVQPWTLCPLGDRRANAVLELPAGTLDRHEISGGGQLCIN